MKTSKDRSVKRFGKAGTGVLGVLGLSVVLIALSQGTAFSDEQAVRIPAPAVDEPNAQVHSETAVLAGGCFWGVQGVFEHVHGVKRVVSGYSGGSGDTAHYERVSEGDTGHAESVQITFDPTQISYGRLLQIYFSVVLDPTQVNRQGPDSGTQYRSVIFTASGAQLKVAQSYIAQLDKAHAFPAPIATKTTALKGFYPAEAYHQDFLVLHPDYPYIAINDVPKVENLKRIFPQTYMAKPVLTTASNAVVAVK